MYYFLRDEQIYFIIATCLFALFFLTLTFNRKMIKYIHININMRNFKYFQLEFRLLPVLTSWVWFKRFFLLDIFDFRSIWFSIQMMWCNLVYFVVLLFKIFKMQILNKFLPFCWHFELLVIFYRYFFGIVVIVIVVVVVDRQ